MNTKIKNNIKWVGKTDWELRSFHAMNIPPRKDQGVSLPQSPAGHDLPKSRCYLEK